MYEGNLPSYTDMNGEHYECFYGTGTVRNGELQEGTTKLGKLNFEIIGTAMIVRQYYAGKPAYKRRDYGDTWTSFGHYTELAEDVIDKTLDCKVDNEYQRIYIARAKELMTL